MSNKKYYCPCCGHRFNHFSLMFFMCEPLSYDNRRYRGMNPFVICPHCFSLPRHRILATYLNEYISELKNKRILIFAAEASVKSWFDNQKIAYTTADLFDKKAEYNIDIMDTGFKDNSFDFIICNHVLEHVKDYKRALKELHRIISPGQHIIISFPIDFKNETLYEDDSIHTRWGRIRAFGQYDHVRLFGKNSKELLKEAGFEVEEIRGEDFDSEIRPIVGPADYDANVLFLLSK